MMMILIIIIIIIVVVIVIVVVVVVVVINPLQRCFMLMVLPTAELPSHRTVKGP